MYISYGGVFLAGIFVGLVVATSVVVLFGIWCSRKERNHNERVHK